MIEILIEGGWPYVLWLLSLFLAAGLWFILYFEF